MQARRRTYWPNCMVCSYEKKNKDFRYRVMHSTYFDPNGIESAAEVLAAFGMPFKTSTFYQHMNRHRRDALEKAQKLHEGALDKFHHGPKPILNAVEGDVIKRSSHELALQEIVAAGREKLAADDLPITLTGLINASKALADIDKSTKDRRLEGIKTMFKGITGEPGTSKQRED